MSTPNGARAIEAIRNALASVYGTTVDEADATIASACAFLTEDEDEYPGAPSHVVASVDFAARGATAPLSVLLVDLGASRFATYIYNRQTRSAMHGHYFGMDADNEGDALEDFAERVMGEVRRGGRLP